VDAASLSADPLYAVKSSCVNGLNSSNLVAGVFLIHPFHHFISASVRHTRYTTGSCLTAQFLAVEDIKIIWGVRNR